MPIWLSRLLLGLFAFGLMFAIHYYLWRRTVRDTRLSPPWRRVATIALIVLGSSIPLTMVLTRLVDASIGMVLGWPVFVWFGLMVIMFLGFGLVDVARAIRWGVRRVRARSRTPAEQPDFDPQRRQLFARVAGGAVVTAAAGVSSVGAYQALRDADVEQVPITLSRLPPALDGFTIVQLTDIHVGLTISRAFVQNMVERTNTLQPDLIAITGDLVDGDVPTLRDAVAPLADLSAPHGVYFVTGNHEYYSGYAPWIEQLTRLGIHVLDNKRVSIGRGQNSFDLAGINDLEGKRYGHAPDLEQALAGRDSTRELVLLAHQPRQVYDTKGYGVGLVLSGHTHGGQIWPWHYLVKIQQRGLLAGLDRRGDTQVYTSRGTGYWGPPLRVGAPPEIAKIILKSPTTAPS